MQSRLRQFGMRSTLLLVLLHGLCASAAPWRWPRAVLRFFPAREPARVTSIEVEGARVLPRDIVARAAAASGLLEGHDLRTDAGRGAIGTCIEALNSWYQQQGFLFARVSPDVLVTRDGRLQLRSAEPVVAPNPVRVRFLRKPRDGDSANASVSANPAEWEEIRGRTRERVLAKALHLVPGETFRWDPNRWRVRARTLLAPAPSTRRSRGHSSAGRPLRNRGFSTL